MKAINRDTLLHNLRQGEILPRGRSDEDEARLVHSDQSSRRLKNPVEQTRWRDQSSRLLRTCSGGATPRNLPGNAFPRDVNDPPGQRDASRRKCN